MRTAPPHDPSPDQYRRVAEAVRAVLQRNADECAELVLNALRGTIASAHAEPRRPPRSPRAPVASLEVSDTDREFARRIMRSAGWPTTRGTR